MDENTLLVNQRIAQNLIAFRKKAGWTQAELAEKINYSDKSVSKWESGNGVPDIYILLQLADLFGVTVNDLLSEKTPIATNQKRTGLHTLIILLSSGIVWLVATCIFAFLQLLPVAVDGWLAFLFALPINAIVAIVFASVWHYKTLHFVSVSALVWTGLLCVYLLLGYLPATAEMQGLWVIFLIGVPLQILEVLWAFFRLSIFRQKANKAASKGVRE